MSYQFHRGDLYFELLDQFNNSHGDYEFADLDGLIEVLKERGAEVVTVAPRPLDIRGHGSAIGVDPGTWLLLRVDP